MFTVDVRANVTRLPNGTVVMQWQLPSEVRDEVGVAIDVNWGQGWIPISEGLRAPSGYDPFKPYQVMFRLRREDWESFVYVTIPPVQLGEEEEKKEKVDVVLIYCVVFGFLLAGCAVLVTIIVGLKCVQWSRRDKDKSKFTL